MGDKAPNKDEIQLDVDRARAVYEEYVLDCKDDLAPGEQMVSEGHFF